MPRGRQPRRQPLQKDLPNWRGERRERWLTPLLAAEDGPLPTPRTSRLLEDRVWVGGRIFHGRVEDDILPLLIAILDRCLWREAARTGSIAPLDLHLPPEPSAPYFLPNPVSAILLQSLIRIARAGLLHRQ